MKTFYLVALALALSTRFAAAEPNSESVRYDGSHSDFSFVLENDETKTVYEQKQVQDTCYNAVTHMETECHDETHHVCGPDTIHQVCENEIHHDCHTETHNDCGPVSHQECDTVDHNVCHNETHQECSPETHQECTSQQVCHEVNHVQQCSTQQDCHPVTEQNCHEVSNQVCQNVPTQECKQVTQTECHDVSHDVCTDVPQNVCHDEHTPNCHDETQNVCSQVAKVVQEPYSCPKTVTVPVTQTVTETASVSLHFDESVLDGDQKADDFVCSLDDGSVGLTLSTKTERLLIESLSQTQTTASIGVRGLSLDEAKAPLTKGLGDASISSTSLKFSLGEIRAPSTLNLRVSIDSLVPEQRVKLRSEMLSSADDGRTLITIPLSQLGILPSSLHHGSYVLHVRAAAAAGEGSGVLNPSLLENAPQLYEAAQLNF